MKQRTTVNPDNAKSKDYQKILEQAAVKGVCLFCPENFVHHRKPILKKLGGWLITEATWPYENTEHHLLIIPEEHKITLEELTLFDFAMVQRLVAWARQEREIPGAGLLLRFGDTIYTGATVCHLHFHLMVPTINQDTGRANVIMFPIG